MIPSLHNMLHKSGLHNALHIHAPLLTRVSVAVALLAACPCGISAKKKAKALPEEAPMAVAMDGLILETPAYRWVADTIFQGPFKAYAPNDTTYNNETTPPPAKYIPLRTNCNITNNKTPKPP